MSAKIISGLEMRSAILEELKLEVLDLKKNFRSPGLVTILVGDNPASVSYVNLKIRTAKELGFYEIQDNRPADFPEDALIDLIKQYNNDPLIDGILVQVPLPAHINENKIIEAISPEKDVDGFHPDNLGRMLIGGEAKRFVPCTPAAIQEMLIRANVEINGAEVVVVGRSNLVGKPVTVLLSARGKGANATVTCVHTGTKDLPKHCKTADILIVAAGTPELVQADWIKKGAVVIDVGVNRVGFNEKTNKAILRGDVNFSEVSKVASQITPVPGGVGPMTITMLMKSTIQSARLKQKEKEKA